VEGRIESAGVSCLLPRVGEARRPGARAHFDSRTPGRKAICEIGIDIRSRRRSGWAASQSGDRPRVHRAPAPSQSAVRRGGSLCRPMPRAHRCRRVRRALCEGFSELMLLLVRKPVPDRRIHTGLAFSRMWRAR
jgi:hypothetical protein